MSNTEMSTSERRTPAAAALGVVVWLAGTALVLVISVRAKEACSSEIGSISPTDSTRLLLPCDLVGWLAASTTIATLSMLGLATVCRAWRQWPTAGAAIASVIVVQLVCVIGLRSVGLA